MKPKDTTGAGDSFLGALAAQLVSILSISQFIGQHRLIMEAPSRMPCGPLLRFTSLDRASHIRNQSGSRFTAPCYVVSCICWFVGAQRLTRGRREAGGASRRLRDGQSFAGQSGLALSVIRTIWTCWERTRRHRNCLGVSIKPLGLGCEI